MKTGGLRLSFEREIARIGCKHQAQCRINKALSGQEGNGSWPMVGLKTPRRLDRGNQYTSDEASKTHLVVLRYDS